MYGIFSYIYREKYPNAGKYTKHGAFGIHGCSLINTILFIHIRPSTSWPPFPGTPTSTVAGSDHCRGSSHGQFNRALDGGKPSRVPWIASLGESEVVQDSG